jgi:signal transduction histidine kinase
MSDPLDLDTPEGLEQRTPIADAHFSVEARLAIQLGRESISSSITAILELVKNAYDADATKVSIRFKDLNTLNPMMIIEDDGFGMTVDDLRNYWMVIGTSNKVKLRKSNKNRVLTGEKGLGRLGLDRLCATTAVQSIVQDAQEGLELIVDWTKYERDDARLEDVSHKVYGIPSLRRDPITEQWNDYPHGTRLVLTGLKDDWTEDTIADLVAELSLLVSPFAGSEDFCIELNSGMNWRSVDGRVQTPSSLLGAAQWKVVAQIKDDNSVHMRMESGHHNRIYEEGPVMWEERFPGWGIKPFCGSLRFEFYFFPRKATTLGEQTISLTTIRTFLDSNQGLRVYRDGFRVKPYGNPNGDGDWLRLSYRRVTSPEGVTQDSKPGNWRVGYNQVVGAVFVSREKNAELLDQTNREGLVEGKAFAHLRVFAEEAIRFFELSNQDYEMSLEPKRSPREEARQQADESVRATEGALKKLSQVAGTVGSLLGGIKKQLPLPELDDQAIDIEDSTHKTLGDIQKTLDDAKEKLEQSAKIFRAEDERESSEKDTLANLASLGILAAAFGHETLGWASSCANNAGWLERNLPNYFFFATPEAQDAVRQKLEDTGTQARRIETFAEFSIGNVKPEKRRRTTFCVKKVIQNVFKAFHESLRVQRNIRLDVHANLPTEPCLIKGYPIDWESVLVNLITNAVWAMTKNQRERAIRVSLSKDDSNFRLTFDDSGIGIAAGTEERIFLPTYSTKKNDRGQPNGTGMGLTIVKNFVEQNTGGSIHAHASGGLGGASFVILIPAAKEKGEA